MGSGGTTKRPIGICFANSVGCGVCDDEAKVLGVSPSTGYELMHEKDFPVLKVGNRMVVPKEEFISWVKKHTGGADG